MKTSAAECQEFVLKPIVKPLKDTFFAGVDWTFQQVSARVHVEKNTQKRLEENILNFGKSGFKSVRLRNLGEVRGNGL